jgi:hypothetical protein
MGSSVAFSRSFVFIDFSGYPVKETIKELGVRIWDLGFIIPVAANP